MGSTLRCWNWHPSELGQLCTLVGGTFSSGRTRENPHDALEFGGCPTASAAAYVPGLCADWAACIRDLLIEPAAAAAEVIPWLGAAAIAMLTPFGFWSLQRPAVRAVVVGIQQTVLGAVVVVITVIGVRAGI